MPSSLSHDRVQAIHEDLAGSLWIGTDGGGLSRLDRARGTFTRYRHEPSNPRSLDCLGVPTRASPIAPTEAEAEFDEVDPDLDPQDA